MKRLGILTGGGDAPGLNAVIRAVAKSAHNQGGFEVLGIRDGYDGLLEFEGVFRLTPDKVRGILPRGGTILGTANRGVDPRRPGGGSIGNVEQPVAHHDLVPRWVHVPRVGR